MSIKIGDCVVDRFGNYLGRVVEITDLEQVMIRNGTEYDATVDEIDLPWLICENGDVCMYEATLVEE
jgi:hypothetical protein